MTCLLRRTFDKDSKYHAIPSGLVAGAAFAMFPNNTVALYVMWKSLQVKKKYNIPLATLVFIYLIIILVVLE